MKPQIKKVLKNSKWLEARQLLPLLQTLPRSTLQINQPFTADCEIIKLNKNYLALTIDSIADEIQCGLYDDPFLAGWMTAVVSLSDLSATALRPLGLLISTQWQWQTKSAYKKRFFSGLKACLKRADTALLGGDSGGSLAHDITSVGVGMGAKAITRIGAKEGNLLLLSGKPGRGAAFALQWLYGRQRFGKRIPFRPFPFLFNERLVSKLADAAIDTSDGVISSLIALMEINHLSAEIEIKTDQFDAIAARWMHKKGCPLATLLFIEHGDYQLLLATSEKKWKSLSFAEKKQFLVLGRMKNKRTAFSISINGKKRQIDPFLLHNCSDKTLLRQKIAQLNQILAAK